MDRHNDALTANKDARNDRNSGALDADPHRVLEDFNATGVSYPQGTVIQTLFEEQVRRTPSAPAVVHGRESLTYGELNRRANQLARHLRSAGVGPEELVGICVERGLELVIGLLGILKAGGAYLPLDPDYPPERLAYILKDAAPSVLLVEQGLQRRLPTVANVTLVVAGQARREIANQPVENLDARTLGLRPDHLAYVIYTSGSTGQPKGVAIEHRNAVNLIRWARDAVDRTVFALTLQSTSLNFDLSVYECLVPLSTGGCIQLVQNALELVKQPIGVTLINTVPSAMDGIMTSSGLPQTVRAVNLAGEVLRKELVDRIFASGTVQHVCNLYGPSETTTYSTWLSMSRQQGFVESIGRPIANTKIYVLDSSREPMPVGQAGEIYIGGAGVARGYLNRPALTAERFLSDPFDPDPNARMYKTGDLGRWRSDGTLEYLGRNDSQIKLRGFRIELGEIESHLTNHELVRGAAVIVREEVPGEKRLVAYVTLRVPDEQTAQDPKRLQVQRRAIAAVRSTLEAALPAHMIPSAMVALEKFPLSPNGKIDRRALPAPTLQDYYGEDYETPKGELETAIAGIWAETLRLARVGRRDRFFQLGGNSLQVVRMRARLREKGLFTEWQMLYRNPTLADFASDLEAHRVSPFEVAPNAIPDGCEVIEPEMLPLVKLERSHLAKIAASVPGGMRNIQDIYPLIPLQEGILFHHLVSAQEGKGTYILPILVQLASRLDLDKFLQALQQVIDRHDVLRTAVLWDGLPRAVQVVWRRATLPVQEITLAADRHAVDQLEGLMDVNQQRLDVGRAPLMQVQVAKDPNAKGWYALLRLHHLVHDHASIDALLAEVQAHVAGQTESLLPPVPYRNYVVHVLEALRTHDADAFFRGKLADMTEPTAPFGLLDVHANGSDLGEARAALDGELVARIRACARTRGVTAATLFHAAWSLVVARTSGRNDVVFGTVLLGKMQSADEGVRALGLFINTLPLRLRLQGRSVNDLTEQTHRELVELLNYEQASLAVAQRGSGIGNAFPLFTSLLNYVHSEDEATSMSTAAPFRVLSMREWTNYPIALSVEDRREGFTLIAQTDRRIDPHRVTGYLSAAMVSLVQALESAPEQPATELSILPARERNQLVTSCNATHAPFPQHRLVHERFEEQARRTPEATAVECDQHRLTYGELNRRANRLAHQLVEHGLRPDERVGLYVDRSPEMIIGMLAILKAAGAYVPLDASYPADRLQFMIRDSAPVAVLTPQRLRDSLPSSNCPVLIINADDRGRSDALDTNPDPAQQGLKAHHLVYIIYTSGSTGTPKGVMVTHRNLTNLMHWHCGAFGVVQGCRSSCVAAVGFDAAAWEVWPTLCAGGTLVLASPELTRDVDRFLAWWAGQPLDVSFLPTPLAELAFSQGIHNKRLQTLLVGGDRLNHHPATESFRLINNYGPTECTVVATSGQIQHGDRVMHIGRPIGNTQIYVLDEHLQIVPQGVAGEIYIGGASVARGYLNRAELTADRFVADPFTHEPGARLYRTGDLGKWREDGTIAFLGRNDDQVKIRGNRIELGEVEAQLVRLPEVREVAVIVREDVPGDKRLVAYVTGQEEGHPRVEALRDYLQTALPSYMVPSAFVILKSFPMTPNGKLDRRALPAPILGALADAEYEAPEGVVEETLATIWQDLLSIERVGRQAHFFDLGGHSLLAMQVVGRIRSSFSVELPINALLVSPTLREIAEKVNALRREHALDALAEGGDEIQELLERVRTMPDSEARALSARRAGSRR